MLKIVQVFISISIFHWLSRDEVKGHEALKVEGQITEELSPTNKHPDTLLSSELLDCDFHNALTHFNCSAKKQSCVGGS